MVNYGGKKGKWFPGVLKTIQRLAEAKKVVFTHKVTLEVSHLGMGIDFDDVCDILSSLKASDFWERLKSKQTQEWLYVFKPDIGGTIIYIKVLVRTECVVISFHEDDYEI